MGKASAARRRSADIGSSSDDSDGEDVSDGTDKSQVRQSLGLCIRFLASSTGSPRKASSSMLSWPFHVWIASHLLQ